MCCSLFNVVNKFLIWLWRCWFFVVFVLIVVLSFIGVDLWFFDLFLVLVEFLDICVVFVDVEFRILFELVFMEFRVDVRFCLEVL